MAAAFAERYPRCRGLVAGPRVGTRSPAAELEWFDAGHPDPNAESVAAGRRALALASAQPGSGPDDVRLVVLLSGGASALLAAPASGVTLEDKIATGRALMHAGMAIGEVNCVRKHLSDVKGGFLAAAAGATLTLAISDVHGPVADDPAVIGSGPTVGDPTTFAEALAIVRRAAGVPERVRTRLAQGSRGEHVETIKPGDARLRESRYAIIGNRATAIEGARAAAAALGYRVAVEAAAVVGESRDAARDFVARAVRLARESGRPLCIVAGGETTVTVRGHGRGGRNQEFALAAAPSLETLAAPAVLASIGTDGVDGPTDAAGAIVDSTTLGRAAAAGLDWESTLAGNDAYHFFQPLGDLIVIGPTGTNVGDIQLLLVADAL